MSLKQRKSAQPESGKGKQELPPQERPISNMKSLTTMLRSQPLWIILAASSGACAAFNGVFAKLTTTELTSSLASNLSKALSLAPDNKVVEFSVRGFFFGMNLLFNGAMWALFTAALTRADSTTRVSVVNTSFNFLVTAALGWMIFSEKLPPLWWVGASLLAAGNVVIGRREQAEKPGGTIGLDETREEAEGLLGGSGSANRETESAEGDLLELNDTLTTGKPSKTVKDEQQRLKQGEDADAPI